MVSLYVKWLRGKSECIEVLERIARLSKYDGIGNFSTHLYLTVIYCWVDGSTDIHLDIGTQHSMVTSKNIEFYLTDRNALQQVNKDDDSKVRKGNIPE